MKPPNTAANPLSVENDNNNDDYDNDVNTNTTSTSTTHRMIQHNPSTVSATPTITTTTTTTATATTTDHDEDSILMMEAANHATATVAVQKDHSISTTEQLLLYQLEVEEEELGQDYSSNEKEEEDRCGFLKFMWNRMFCKYFLPMFVVFGTTIGIMVASGYRFERDSLPTFVTDWIFESRNGYDAVDVNSIPKWMTFPTATTTDLSLFVSLEVLNGLDESWQPYLERTIQEWNAGIPKVVDLRVSRIAVTSDCTFVRGKIVICNGDYGPTDFHGMNHLLINENDNTISASLAQLNEHYMEGASQARKDYTICHELGHAFGLPHTDENHANINLGNCMDYTNRPWSNRSPDKHIFEFLEQVYSTTTSSSSSSSSNTKDANGRLLRMVPANADTFATTKEKSKSSDIPNVSDTKDVLPDSVVSLAQDALSKLVIPSSYQRGGTNGDSAAVIDLGHGYSLRTHFLFP